MTELFLDRVTKQFKNKIAVDNVSLRLKTGVYGFLGANGAGKTTLLRMLSGVLKPTAGEISYHGMEIGMLGGEYRRVLGYLPQDFGYYPNFRARRFLEYLAAQKAVPNSMAKQKVQEMLELTGLAGAERQKISTYSGGMLRRLGIAQALLNDPEVLILDEPTAGLDPKERIRFRNMISAFSKGRIVILSTHIVSDVEYIADEILLMKQGQIIGQGTAAEITEGIRGCVWECYASPEEAARIQAAYPVSSLKNEVDHVHLRLISQSCPFEGAAAAKPGLEDVYLYYFEEGSENVHHMERRTV